MEYTLSTLGIPSPSLKARQALRRCRTPSKRETSTSSSSSLLEPLLHHRDSLLCLLDLRYLAIAADAKYDDDTASTVSCSDSDASSSGAVTFANPLVTDVFLRPVTTREDKARLYYCDRDYREFRREYHLCGKREPRDSVVCFCETVVSEVFEYAAIEEKELLYYSESDLKRYEA